LVYDRFSNEELSMPLHREMWVSHHKDENQTFPWNYFGTVCKVYLKNTMFQDWHICFQKISSSTHSQTAPSGLDLPQCRGFTITLRHNTLGRTPQDESSDRRRDLYLTKNMPSAAFQTAVQANEWPQTQALGTVVTETTVILSTWKNNTKNYSILQKKTFCDNGLRSDLFQ